MKVTINGVPREVAAGTTVAEAVSEMTPAAAGIAVAVNDEVVRRADWAATRLGPGDRVEVLTAVQGG
ncbi:thiamine biosynthesis protein ThiS [Sphaerisporangium rufum]|uniref:Thiamine biosynthesis protein ThiS n=1 Tax=Sphaerisporangium rufum TaxID=1381558 RepID=A0A919QXX2_9ACTN|nr:sulfur carrier protein ThiS [Sphaerisporangium rufum]GII76114.1 thiamine biosynthesis protein ThiS [Sphaerisporangium rufum]